MPGKRILITGGAGFIGSHIAKACIDDGMEVWILDNLATGSKSNIPSRARFVRGDVSNNVTFSRLPRKRFDGVFHLAAQSSGEVSHDKPGWDLKANTLGTLLALDWAYQNRVPRFLFSSSMSVYGNPKKNPIRESDSCDAVSFYGISKVCAERYISYFSRKGMATTVFRLFSIYGPGQDMANMKQGIVSIYMAFLLAGKEIHVKGSPNRFRDLTYIDDVVDAWLRAFHSRNAVGGTFNLGTGHKTLIKELVAAEIRAFGLDPMAYPVRYEGSTPDDTFGVYADIRAARRVLGWKPKVNLDAGLKRMVKWCRGAPPPR